MNQFFLSFVIVVFGISSWSAPNVKIPVITKPIKIGPGIPNPFPGGPITKDSKKKDLGGIRNVGNGKRPEAISIVHGGGLAEMRLIYLHQNLDRFLNICLVEQNSCRLSQLVQSEWKNLVFNQNRDSLKYSISFVPSLDNEKGYVSDDQKLTISSQKLYNDMESPKAFGHLLAFLIAVRQDIAGSANSFSVNLDFATAMFDQMSVVENLYRMTGVPTLIRLAQLKVSDGENLHFLFSLEDKDKTVDLTRKVLGALPCGQLSDWNFSQWNSSYGAGIGYIFGFANGMCDGVQHQNKILIQFNLDEAYLIDGKKITIKLFAN